MRSKKLVVVALSCVLTVVLMTRRATSESTSSKTVTRQVHRAEGEKVPRFVHCVFFTLKPEVKDDQITEFIRDCYLLKQVPSVRKLEAGRRDERMTRDVNVTDYTIGLVVYFDDKEGHDLYNAHALHQKLVEKHKDQWSKVRVFDFDAKQ